MPGQHCAGAHRLATAPGHRRSSALGGGGRAISMVATPAGQQAAAKDAAPGSGGRTRAAAGPSTSPAGSPGLPIGGLRGDEPANRSAVRRARPHHRDEPPPSAVPAPPAPPPPPPPLRRHDGLPHSHDYLSETTWQAACPARIMASRGAGADPVSSRRFLADPPRRTPPPTAPARPLRRSDVAARGLKPARLGAPRRAAGAEGTLASDRAPAGSASRTAPARGRPGETSLWRLSRSAVGEMDTPAITLLWNSL